MANLLGKMGDLYKMQQEAKAMQKKMKQVNISGFSKNEDVEILIDGTQDIIEMGIKDELMTLENKDKLIKSIIQAMKDAQKKLQKQMMSEMDLDQIKKMFSNS